MLVNISLINGSYAIAEADSVEEAELWARWEFGNSNVLHAAEANAEDIDWYEAWNGVIHRAAKLSAYLTSAGAEDWKE